MKKCNHVSPYIMETIALNLEYDFETRKSLVRCLAFIDEAYNESKELNLKPNDAKQNVLWKKLENC